jgi:4-diphosphocytidyl-2-C-methyl-D-erythritol kinase
VTTAVTVSAPGKINLCLGVGSPRPDGFHPLATVYQAVGLYDQVTVSHAADDATEPVTVSVVGHHRLDVREVPTDGTNIAARAVMLLARHHGLERAVHVAIDKGIPVAGGMAGGSADAAAALLACDRLWGLRTPAEELATLAAELGSDVPFALVGGTAIGSGRGEVVTPLLTRGTHWWVVLESPVGLSTPAVYREFDAMQAGADEQRPVDPEIPDRLVGALLAHDVPELGASLSNDLQRAALRLRPELAAALGEGLAASAHGAVLSGSGPSCLFLCDSRTHAAQVADALAAPGRGPISLAPGPVPGAHVVAKEV